MKAAAVLALAGCSFQPGTPPSSPADLTPGTWTIDSVADFSAGAASELTIEPTGKLTELGYCYGGLVEHGEHGQKIWDNGDALPLQWSKLNGVTPAGAALWNGSYFDTSQSLANVGIMMNDTFALWLEGEAYLDANDELAIDANSAAFIDVWTGKAWNQYAASRTDGMHASAPLPAAGWYRVRIGYGEGSNNGFLDVRHGPSGSFLPFSRDRLRAPCSEIAGTARLQFFRQIYGGGNGNGSAPISHFEEGPLLAQLPMLDDRDWTARWSGQIHAATAGMYELTVDADDGSHVQLGAAAPVDTHWDRDVKGAATAKIQAALDAGWNDLIVDYNQVDMMQALAVTLSIAPDATLVGMTVPRALLRAVEPRGDRLIANTVVQAPATIQNDSGVPTLVNTRIVAAPSELVTRVDVTIGFTTQHQEQLVFTLQPPGGTPIVIRNHAGTGAATYVHVATTDPAFVGHPAAGVWALGVADDVTGGNASTLTEYRLTVHTGPGPEQIALSGVWTSAVKDVGAPIGAITGIAVAERAPTASDVRVRTCAQPDCSDDPAWTTPGDPVAATPYVQAQVTMHSDGTKEGELDSLAISYGTE